jgi:hypothetical protein
MSRWFRHYAGMMRDDKLVRVAIRSKQAVERVVWVWGAILESAAEVNGDGRYDFDAAEAAYFLRADEDELLAILNALESAGHVAEGAVVKWRDRQFKSDSSAERQSRYRKRHKAGDGDGQPEGSSEPSDAVVTSPSRHRDAPDTELETDTEDSVANATGKAVSRPVDLKATVFNSGAALLVSKGMATDREARSLLGRLRKNYGDAPVIDALAALQGASPSDPAPYLVEILETRYGKRNTLRGNRPDPSLDFLRAANADLEAERGGAADRRGDWTALPAHGAN